MNVVLMSDLEGVSLVDRASMIDEEGAGYQFARQQLMADVNAAVEGALEGGAHEVFVIDGHHLGKNFIPGELHAKARQISIPEWYELVWTGEIQAYMEVGCHAMPGTWNGFLDHVQDPDAWFRYMVNGVPSGEIAQGAIFCGAFGVPFVMVSGDEAACTEAGSFLGKIAVAPVKRGQGRNAAKCRSAAEARAAIREAAKDGVALAVKGAVEPYTPSLPLKLELELFRSDMCDKLAEKLGDTVERIDGRTLRMQVEKVRRYTDILFHEKKDR